MKKTQNKRTKRTGSPMLARSPEAFPKLTIFPEGWDLEQPSNEAMLAQAKKKKKNQYSFPKTTDAIL